MYITGVTVSLVRLITRCVFFGKLTHALGVFSTSARQLLTDLGEGSLRYQGKLESLATSFRDVRCWYSASTPSCYMTVCRPLIAWTDDLTYYITFYFLIPQRQRMA